MGYHRDYGDSIVFIGFVNVSRIDIPSTSVNSKVVRELYDGNEYKWVRRKRVSPND